MPRKKLTDLFIDRAPVPAKGERVEYFDTTFPALALRVTDSGHKSWSLFYRNAGRLRRWTIGAYPAFRAQAAREAASKALHRLAEGIDPADEKLARRTAPQPVADDVRILVQEYIERQVKKNNRESTYRETKRIFDQDVLPEWGARPIGSITKRDVIALVDRKFASGAEVQANRVLARVKTFFAWALSKDHIAIDPCAGVKKPKAERARDRVLGHDEIRAFWSASEQLGWPFGPLFKLLLLTGQRRDEVATIEWSEINLEKALWSIPREKAKNDAAHDVHLSAEALTVIRALPRVAGPYLFSTNGGRTPVSGFSRAKGRLDALMLDELRTAASERGKAGTTLDLAPFILHDLRRTAATGMADLRFPPHVVDRILNHVSGSIRGVARIYNRAEYLDERKSALEAWGRAVAAKALPMPTSNVVELSAART